MTYMRRLRGMKRGNYEFRMPEDEREVLDVADDADDEDGYSWDSDRGGSLGNEEEDEEGE